MTLASGYEVPQLPYLLVLLAAVALIVAGLREDEPRVDDRTVLALSPWMVAGAAGYVTYQLGAVPSIVAPLASSPAVYASTFVVAGTVWLAARRTTSAPLRVVAGAGVLAAVAVAGVALAAGAARGTLSLAWPAIGLVASAALAAAVWASLRRAWPEVAAATGGVGALAVFAHALDGVSTAIGVDVLGFGEQTPLSRVIIEATAGLPTADALGSGWLFVVVKLALAVVVVYLFAEYVEEEPTEGFLLLGVVAAVGLGPGAHNLLLYATAVGPA